MKKIALLLVLMMIATASCSLIKGTFGGYTDHFSTAFCYRGQWSPWQEHYFPRYSFDKSIDDMRIECSNSPNGHIIGLKLSDRGGNAYFEFKITDYVKGKKSCTGTIEYYVNDKYPTAEAFAKDNEFVRPNHRTDITPSVKRTTKAAINIVNGERSPAVFNVWFDNIGVGFDVRNVYWH